MDAHPLLDVEPSELSFPIELNKQLSCSIRLLNRNDDYVAFKLLSTNRKNYVVRPRIGILSPRSTCDITVSMRALREAPNNMRCKDKFMIQSAVASPHATLADAPRMFDKETGHGFQECILRVVYSTPIESSNETSIIENPDSHVTSIIENPDSQVHEATESVVEPHDNDLQSTRRLLAFQPSEIRFPASQYKESKEQSCSIQLSNVTEHYVAFRVKTACLKLSIQPESGLLLPQSQCDITVRRQVESRVQLDIQNEDKLLIQSVVVPAASTTDSTILDMAVSEFDKEESSIEECELPVVYISRQEKDSNSNGELILRGVISGLLVLAFLYLTKQTLSWIWSLTMVAVMLMIKMIKKLVSDSVEDWIVKALLYIFMHVLFGRNDNFSRS